MGYLVCDKCGGYYELQEGESPEDFSDECECGGKTRYVETLEGLNNGMEEMGATIICPACGAENSEGTTICKSCKKMIKQKAPISTPQNEKPKKGILETWNKQSTPIKALSILGVCCIGIILIVGVIAMVTPDKTTTGSNTTTPTTTQTDSQSTNSASSSTAEAVQIQVTYSGQWSGAVGDTSGSRSVDGTGTQRFSVSSTGAVSANFQKKDNGTGTLTASIIQGGKTVETQSTTAEYGVASVSHYF